jgi:hypothetical protein
VRKTWFCWVTALVVMVVSVVWQRATGPTHPLSGKAVLAGREIGIRLERANSTSFDQPVRVEVADTRVTGQVAWRRYPTNEDWRTLDMRREGSALVTALPKQPAAGKLEYQVRLRQGSEETVFPPRLAITRYHGDVPTWILGPHIAAMFLSMLLAARAAMEALTGRPNLRTLTRAAFAVIAVGGFLLGPLVLHYAFGEWWGGFPFGNDLTDNKTLLAGLFWAAAVWSVSRGWRARGMVVTAAVVTLVIFAIPHSYWGSELKWDKLPAADAPASTSLPKP